MYGSMRTSLVAIAGTACIAASASFATVELPYSEETTILLETYKNANVGDLDGDGSVTDADFLIWLIEENGEKIDVFDVDEDGQITAADEALSVALFLNKLSGDVVKDGEVDAEDALEISSRILEGSTPEELEKVNSPTGDVNGDGVEDAQDVMLTSDRLGSVITLDSVVVSTAILANTRGTETSYLYGAVDGHVRSISSDYPGHDLGLSQRPKQKYPPPNHDYAISRTWGHERYTSELTPEHSMMFSKEWPSNHLESVSDLWQPSTSHLFDISRTWPANHNPGISKGWNPDVFPPEGHAPSVSAQQTHSTSISKLWPTNHLRSVSLNPLEHDETLSIILPHINPDDDTIVPARSQHLEAISATWPAEHDRGLSTLVYPPNHWGSVSSTWLPPTTGHQLNVSYSWPPNHLRAVSDGWPIPVNWPPNHGESISSEWPSPAESPDPIQWFPPGHDVITTVRDIEDIVPTLPAIPGFDDGGTGQ